MLSCKAYMLRSKIYRSIWSYTGFCSKLRGQAQGISNRLGSLWTEILIQGSVGHRQRGRMLINRLKLSVAKALYNCSDVDDLPIGVGGFCAFRYLWEPTFTECIRWRTFFMSDFHSNAGFIVQATLLSCGYYKVRETQCCHSCEWLDNALTCAV
jgi:hypothetical protein